ncbi:MAG: hypothetical protein MZW92_27555 [Comamonadaceae bacterium]|nr:hypothetical protein [Comamonadaceae bacterium]
MGIMGWRKDANHENMLHKEEPKRKRKHNETNDHGNDSDTHPDQGIRSCMGSSCLATANRHGAESERELAKKALNPVAAMISLPLQFNQDYGIGPADDAKRTYAQHPAGHTRCP